MWGKWSNSVIWVKQRRRLNSKYNISNKKANNFKKELCKITEEHKAQAFKHKGKIKKFNKVLPEIEKEEAWKIKSLEHIVKLFCGQIKGNVRSVG